MGPILFLTGIFFLNFLARIIFSPLLPTVEADLRITHSEAGAFFFFISAGYFTTLLFSGFFSSRLLHRGTIILSSLALGLALFLASVTHEIWGFRTALILLGLATGLYLPSGIATITGITDPKHWGKVLAVHEGAPNLGFVAAPLLCEALLLWVSWRAILAVLGLCAIAAGLAYASGDYGGRLPGKAPSLASWRPILKDRSFWIMMLLFSLGIGGSFGVFTMLPLFLINVHGLERSWANTLISLSRISGIGAAFLAGWAVDRAGPKRTLQSVLFFTGLATLGLGVTSGWMLMAAVFLQPLLAVSFFPAGFAALSRLSSESERNVAVSLTIPAAYTIGAGIIPFFIGAMADAGAFSAGIAGVGGLFLSGALLPGFVGGMDPRER